MESRIVDLEIKLGLNEDQIEAMNLALYRQQQQIDQLQQELRTLRQQLQNAQPAEARKLSDDLPPHY